MKKTTPCTAMDEVGNRCIRRHVGRGFCNLHLKRFVRHGDWRVVIGTPRDERLRELQAAACATTQDCILIRGGGQRPAMRWRGKTTPAARVVWEMAYGDPCGNLVLHTCNEGSGAHGCVNINHLKLGDYFDNARDRLAAGGYGHPGRFGESVPTSRLTEGQVREIRRRHATDGISPKVLAADYGVHRATVANIISRRAWAHLD